MAEAYSDKAIFEAIAMLKRCIGIAKTNGLNGSARLLELAKSSMEQSHIGMSKEEVDVVLSLMRRQRLATSRKGPKSRSRRALS